MVDRRRHRPLLGQGSSLVDPPSGQALLRTGGVVAIAGRFALAGADSGLRLIDLRGGGRWRLRWPSTLAYLDEPAVQPGGRLLAVALADPAYQGSGTQVTDVWLPVPATRRLRQLPDTPAAVTLKFTSMAWTSDGRLVWLAETGGHTVATVWRPSERRIGVRPVRLPARDSGGDTFVVWTDARPR